MAYKAVIHTTTRVIRRVTSKETPEVMADETAVDVDEGMDLGGGPWKLDGSNQKVSATQAEWRQAGMDDAFNRAQRAAKRQALMDRLTDMAGDNTLPNRVRQFAAAMLEFLS